jgi:outer membrane protein assembly factor BamB
MGQFMKKLSKAIELYLVLYYYSYVLRFGFRETFMPRNNKHKGTFYFFPAILPLASMMPWIMSAIGIVAGAAGLSVPSNWVKYKYYIVGFGVLCFLAAGGFYLYNVPAKQVRIEGTRIQLPEDYPPLRILGDVKPVVDKELKSFGTLWSAPLKRQPLSSPIIFEDMILYGGYDGSVEAISRKDGARIWSLRHATYVFALTLGPDGVLYSGEGLHETQSAHFTSIDPRTGKINWRREFLGHLEERAAFDMRNHMAVISAGGSGLWAVDTRTGDVFWNAPIGHIDARALIHKDRVYIPAQEDEAVLSSSFYALDKSTGKKIWSVPQLGQPWGSPFLEKTQNMIITTSGRGQIGVDRETDAGAAYGISLDGEIKWQSTLPGMPLQPSLYLPENDMMIQTTTSGDLVALSVIDGRLIWHEKGDEGDRFMSAATIVAEGEQPWLASVSKEGILSVRNALTGVELARRIVGKGTWSSPVSKGDTLYIFTADGVSAYGGLNSLRGGE